MKKRISLLLIALVLVTSLFGCRNNEDTSTTVENEFKAQMTFNGSSTLAPVISAIATAVSYTHLRRL